MKLSINNKYMGWVAIAKLLARPLAKAAFWVRIQTTVKNRVDISKGVDTLAQKSILKNINKL
jgi:hypothetical protein